MKRVKPQSKAHRRGILGKIHAEFALLEEAANKWGMFISYTCSHPLGASGARRHQGIMPRLIPFLPSELLAVALCCPDGRKSGQGICSFIHS